MACNRHDCIPWNAIFLLESIWRGGKPPHLIVNENGRVIAYDVYNPEELTEEWVKGDLKESQLPTHLDEEEAQWSIGDITIKVLLDKKPIIVGIDWKGDDGYMRVLHARECRHFVAEHDLHVPTNRGIKPVMELPAIWRRED